MIDSICNLNEILEICREPEKYFFKGNVIETFEINTNLSLIFNITNTNFFQKVALDNLGILFSHRYFIIKVKINNKIKDYSFGLGEDTSRVYKVNDKLYTKTQLFIHDWSVCSEHSRSATNLNKIIKSKYKDFFFGKKIDKNILSDYQLNFLINIHKSNNFKKIITKKYILIKLPFLYSTLGFYYKNTSLYNNIFINCQDFVYFFINNINIFLDIINNYKINFKKKDNWIYITNK